MHVKTKIADRLICKTIGALYNLIRSDFPPVIRIETTNSCNAKCIFCPRDRMTRPLGVMREELYRAIIDECAENHCKAIHLHNFGEPMLDRWLPDRIRYAKDKGIPKVKLFSNGFLLSGDRAAQYLESGIDEIKISIDGSTKEEFEAIRVGLKYDKIVENIEHFIALRNRRNGTGPKVIVACCSTSDKDKTANRLKGIVDAYSFGKIHNWGDQSIEASNNGRLRKPCSRIWRTFTILWNGDVALCCLDFDGKVKLGDINDGVTIKEIWNGVEYKKMRMYHETANQNQIEICSHCTKSFL
ncbi:MAG: radical SAM protein [Candidatus Omnitrophota bacterium]|jgi:radical SAM protein with 4Fe4S-binding SPASM domain|nr:MAG: radical SAM protein [Candidatus Omnitrophota bacterium]